MPMANARCRAAQVMRVFLHRTETFLFTFATAVPDCDVHVVCEERDHEMMFPFQAERLHVRSEDSWLGRRERLNAWLSERERLGLWRLCDLRRPFLRQTLRRIAPDLVHAQFGWQGAWTTRVAAELELPLLTSFYGLDLSQLAQRPRFRASYRELFARGTLFLTEGPAMAATLAGLGCPPDRIRRQVLGIDTERFAFRAPRRPRSGEPVRLLQIASLREKKGHATLLSACAILKAEDVPFALQLVGAGPLEQDLRALAAELGIEDEVEWLGPRSHAECATLLSEADLFVHPSVLASDGDREGGAPAILLEAQARGLPIVATTHDDIPFFVRAGESGLLVPERDADALAAALIELAIAPARWPAMARAGRAHVEAHFERQRSVAALRGYYDEARELYSAAR